MTSLRMFASGFTVVALGAVAPPASLSQSTLTFSWESSPPTVEGVVAGGSVAFLGVAREPLGDSQRVHRVGEVVRAGVGETKVAVPWPDSPVLSRSVWAAVDEATGAFVLSSPSLELIPNPSVEPLRAGETRLSLPDRWLEVLLVRPGAGHWRGTLGDGSSEDRDGRADGAIELDATSLSPLAGSPALTAWAAGDVLIAINLETLRVSTYLVGGAP